MILSSYEKNSNRYNEIVKSSRRGSNGRQQSDAKLICDMMLMFLIMIPSILIILGVLLYCVAPIATYILVPVSIIPFLIFYLIFISCKRKKHKLGYYSIYGITQDSLEVSDDGRYLIHKYVRDGYTQKDCQTVVNIDLQILQNIEAEVAKYTITFNSKSNEISCWDEDYNGKRYNEIVLPKYCILDKYCEPNTLLNILLSNKDIVDKIDENITTEDYGSEYCSVRVSVNVGRKRYQIK